MGLTEDVLKRLGTVLTNAADSGASAEAETEETARADVLESVRQAATEAASTVVEQKLSGLPDIVTQAVVAAMPGALEPLTSRIAAVEARMDQAAAEAAEVEAEAAADPEVEAEAAPVIETAEAVPAEPGSLEQQIAVLQARLAEAQRPRSEVAPAAAGRPASAAEAGEGMCIFGPWSDVKAALKEGRSFGGYTDPSLLFAR